MLQHLIDYSVPFGLFLLMFVAGSEIGSTSIRDALKSRTAVLLGSAGQLAALPLVALAVVAVTNPTPIVAASVLILGLCPGGGISNFYVYLARCNVFLSAIITGVATLLSLATIPGFLFILSYGNPDFAPLHDIPMGRILSQLVALMILPLVIGSLFARRFPAATARLGPPLKLASSALVLAILAAALWSVRGSIDAYIKEMLLCATFFTLGAMFAGGLIGAWNSASDRTVLTIEAGTRNVGLALLLGGTALSRPDFGVFASFMSVYFAVEVTIMLTYANWRASKVRQETLPARRDGRRED